jgi:uncharacterized protein YukE
MTLIRVDPAGLRATAEDLQANATELRALGHAVLRAAAHAPSYDGQFGPKAKALAEQAFASLSADASRLEAHSQALVEKAAAFERADAESGAALASLAAGLPLFSVRVPTFLPEIPTWLWELLIGILPFGDLYDIGKELLKLVTKGETDDLVLLLAALGLAADAGWLDGVVPDPVDAANAGLALLKTLVKGIPPGPARDALKELFIKLAKNADEAPRFFSAAFELLKRQDLFKVLQENPRALAAVLDAGPEMMERVARHPEAAIALAKHQDVAVALLRRAEYVDEILQGGPEAVEQLAKYGDDFAARFLDAIPENGLANVKLLQGMEVSKLAQDMGVNIHIAGRLADTPADVTIRELAAKEVQDLVDDGLSPLEAQLQIAEKYNIGFYQARISSGKSEADVFIQMDDWDALTPLQQRTIRENLADTFDVKVKDVDFYQNIKPLDLDELGIPEGVYHYPDPATSTPNGAISFGADGNIDHPPLGDQEFIQDLEQEMLEEFGGP